MSGNQSNTSNIVAGLNIPSQINAIPRPQVYAQPQVQPQQVHAQMATQVAGQVQQSQVQQSLQSLQSLNQNDVIMLFGQTIQKKYAYIIGGILLLAVGYMLWKWYNKVDEHIDESGDYIDTEDDEPNYMKSPDNRGHDQEQMMEHMRRMQTQQMHKVQQMQERQTNKPMTDKQFDDQIEQAVDDIEI